MCSNFQPVNLDIVVTYQVFTIHLENQIVMLDQETCIRWWIMTAELQILVWCLNTLKQQGSGIVLHQLMSKRA